MKNYTYIFVVLLLSTQITKAQSLSPEVIVSSGDNFSNGTGSLSWSVGEIVTETFSNGSGSLSQGFQQSGIDIITDIDPKISINVLSVYPNPVQNRLVIETKPSEKTKLSYTLLDINGRIIQSNKINANKELIDMEKYAAGSYILNIINNDKGQLNTYKILKK